MYEFMRNRDSCDCFHLQYREKYHLLLVWDINFNMACTDGHNVKNITCSKWYCLQSEFLRMWSIHSTSVVVYYVKIKYYNETIEMKPKMPSTRKSALFGITNILRMVSCLKLYSLMECTHYIRVKSITVWKK